jgi:hypothetical protein
MRAGRGRGIDMRLSVVLLALILVSCRPDAPAAPSVAPLTPQQASLLAGTLHRNHEATGATFTLVTRDAVTGGTVTLEGIVDWDRTEGRAAVHGYLDADGAVTEVAWTRDRVAELRSSLSGPSASGEPGAGGEVRGTFLVRAADPQRQPLDRLVGILVGLATTQPDNAQLVLQNPGAGFVRADVLDGRAVDVLRYSERSQYWVERATGDLVRFEGRDRDGVAPVIVDLHALGPQQVRLPPVLAGSVPDGRG